MLSLPEVLATPASLLRSSSVVLVPSRCITNRRRTRSPLASWSRPLEVPVAKSLSSRTRVVTTSSSSPISAMPTTRRYHSMGRVLTKSSTLSLPRTSPSGRVQPLVGPGGLLVAVVEVMWTFLSISRCILTASPAPPKTYLVRRVLGRGISTCRLSALKVPSCCKRRTFPTRGTLSAFPYPRTSTATVALSRLLWVRSHTLVTLTATHLRFSEH